MSTWSITSNKVWEAVLQQQKSLASTMCRRRETEQFCPVISEATTTEVHPSCNCGLHMPISFALHQEALHAHLSGLPQWHGNEQTRSKASNFFQTQKRHGFAKYTYFRKKICYSSCYVLALL